MIQMIKWSSGFRLLLNLKHQEKIFIYEDLSLYVASAKANDYRYLKSTLTEDEYKLIENSYNTLFEEKEMVNR